MGWRLPDWLLVPGGALSNASALAKGLHELRCAGFIDTVPRIAVVQAEGAAAFHRMVETGAPTLTPVPHPDTAASALNIGHPPNWPKAAHYVIGRTNGVTVAVSDRDMFEAKAWIDRSGIGCEPAAAASVAGLRRLVSIGTIDPDETAVCVLTGSLLKDTDAIARSVRHNARFRPADGTRPVALSLEAVRSLLQ